MTVPATDRPITLEDPWLSALQRRDEQLVHLNASLAIGAEAALADVLQELWQLVLGTYPSLTAAAGPGLPPNLDGAEQAAERTWTNALARWVKPLVMAAYARQYAEREGAAEAPVSVREGFWVEVVERLAETAQRVVQELRATVADNPSDSIDQLRDRVARVLQLDTVTRDYRDRIAEVEDELAGRVTDNQYARRVQLQYRLFQVHASRARSRAFQALAAVAPQDQRARLLELARQAARSTGDLQAAARDLSRLDGQLFTGAGLDPQRRDELKRERAELYRQAYASEGTWRNTARRIARTESTGVLNAATLQRGLDDEQRIGEEFIKRWLATRDDRTRDTHRAANGQVVPLAQKFRVGDAFLDAPGDPKGDPDEVIQCRCALIVLTRKENDQIASALQASAHEEVHMSHAATEIDAVGTDPDNELPIGFRGVFAPLDRPTGDGRMLATPAGGVRFRQQPWPMLFQPKLAEGHEGAVVAGKISRFWVDEVDNELWGVGPFDLESPDGREAARLLKRGFINGMSLDPDDVVFEYDEERELLIFRDWRVMGGTFLPYPAFDEARLNAVHTSDLDVALAASAGGQAPFRQRIEPIYANDPDTSLVASLTAAAAAPATGTTSGVSVLTEADFAPPKLTGPTPLTITEDGRIYGHLAQWGVCHIGIGNACVTAPHSVTGYTHFHSGSVLLDDGRELPVGKITMGGGHADPELGYIPAIEHYDDVCTMSALVRASEDQWGICVAGRMLPHITPEQYTIMRAAPLSGDWRRVGGNLELVAALSVNTPGFGIPRTVAASAGGQQKSLVAAGVVAPMSMQEAIAIEVREAFARERRITKLSALIEPSPEELKARAAAAEARILKEQE